MSKQTVEEAAHFHIKYGNPKEVNLTAAKYSAFVAGSEWQKEQGINWIGVGNGLPVIPEGAEWVNVLISDGKKVEKCDYSRAGFQIYPKPFPITHYAYITLPKTDE